MKFTRHILPILLVLFLAACAKVGSPDGGPYDETPPKLIRSTPLENAVNNKVKKIVLEFDEFVKIENASEKVIVSPPQLEQAEISTSGKKVIVELFDTLKANTTYSIDFSDAIVDNNESNPMGNFAFTFSTGEAVDTMEVSGTVLNAEDLEPIKGIMVGLYRDTVDSVFTTKPFERVARTNGSGKFVIKGVAPGEYKIFALQDADQNFMFNQKSEKIAFLNEVIVPSSKPDLRMDTVWTDSIHYDTIYQVPYTHFLPDDIVLTAFLEEQTNRYMVKNERPLPDRFSLIFSSKSDTLPKLRGLNFNEADAFVIEESAHKDTLQYWIKDTLIAHIDTLSMELTYYKTNDSLPILELQTDTLNMVAKKTLEKIRKEQQQEFEEWDKEQRKKEKKGLPFDSIPPVKKLEVKIGPSGSVDPDGSIKLSFEEPLARLDTAGIHLKLKKDSIWEEVPYYFDTQPNQLYKYELIGEWRPEQEYKLEVDSACFEGIFGKTNNPSETTFKIPALDTYCQLFLNISGAETPVVAQLLSSDKVIKEVSVENGHAEFYFLKPGKYYVRAFADANDDGVWTTGDYATKTQAEDMFYYPGELELKEKWDITQDWDLRATPRDKQKPEAIKKQKPDKEKSVKNRNKERERQLNRN